MTVRNAEIPQNQAPDGVQLWFRGYLGYFYDDNDTETYEL